MNNTSTMTWIGRVLAGIFALFMLGAAIAPKLPGMPVAQETMVHVRQPFNGRVIATPTIVKWFNSAAGLRWRLGVPR
jgi:hypothetical protein